MDLHYESVVQAIMEPAAEDIRRFGWPVYDAYASLGQNPELPLWTAQVEIESQTFLVLELYQMSHQNWVIHTVLRDGRDSVLLSIIAFDPQSSGFCFKCRSQNCDVFTCPIDAPVDFLDIGSTHASASRQIVNIFRRTFTELGCSQYA